MHPQWTSWLVDEDIDIDALKYLPPWWGQRLNKWSGGEAHRFVGLESIVGGAPHECMMYLTAWIWPHSGRGF